TRTGALCSASHDLRMPVVSIRYSLRQRFHASAPDAYAWCTEYGPDDHALMGREGRRKIHKLTVDTVLLTDTAPGPRGEPVTKVRLVRLDSGNLSWTN